MKTRFTILFILLSQLHVFGQSEYKLLFNNAVLEMENNFSGFQDKIEGKEFIYNVLKEQLSVNEITTRAELEKLLQKYIDFFNDDHVYMWISESKKLQSDTKNNTESFLKIIDSTIYIKIPSFNIDCKKQIDSLIEADYSQITSYDNLIIDVRGNRGGQDPAFRSLIPLIYTNPIYLHNLEFLLTENNKNARKIDKTLIKPKMGEFVNLFGKDEFIEVFEDTRPIDKPKNIAILIDENVGSTTEQFLLYAKQSRKVKLFGNNTSGSIDYSNIRAHWLIPDSIAITIPTTRSKRLPENPIDDTGIMPDYYLKDKGEKAIDEVLKIMSEWK